jgi:hypothetical protein
MRTLRATLFLEKSRELGIDDIYGIVSVWYGIVSAMFLQKAWGIRNAYKHGTSVDVFESASERRGADGIDARA